MYRVHVRVTVCAWPICIAYMSVSLQGGGGGFACALTSMQWTSTKELSSSLAFVAYGIMLSLKLTKARSASLKSSTASSLELVTSSPM